MIKRPISEQDQWIVDTNNAVTGIAPAGTGKETTLVSATTDAVTGRVVSLKSGSQDVSAPYTWAQALALGAAGNTGLVIRVSDVGLGAGSHWVSDGTYWRPLGGKVVLGQKSGSQTTPLATFNGNGTFGLASMPVVPAGMLIAGESQLQIFAHVRRVGANATGILSARMGTAKTTSDSTLYALSIAATTNVDTIIASMVMLAETSRVVSTNYLTLGGSGSAASLERTTNINSAAEMGFTFDISSANAGDAFSMIGYSIILSQ